MPYALSVSADSDSDCDVKALEVVLYVLVGDPSTTSPNILPPDPPLSRTGTAFWERETPCSKPIAELASPAHNADGVRLRAHGGTMLSGGKVKSYCRDFTVLPLPPSLPTCPLLGYCLNRTGAAQ